MPAPSPYASHGSTIDRPAITTHRPEQPPPTVDYDDDEDPFESDPFEWPGEVVIDTQYVSNGFQQIVLMTDNVKMKAEKVILSKHFNKTAKDAMLKQLEIAIARLQEARDVLTAAPDSAPTAP